MPEPPLVTFTDGGFLCLGVRSRAILYIYLFG